MRFERMLTILNTVNDKATRRWPDHFAENLPLCGNPASGYYQEIAGAQEGTRTPTELPAST